MVYEPLPCVLHHPQALLEGAKVQWAKPDLQGSVLMPASEVRIREALTVTPSPFPDFIIYRCEQSPQELVGDDAAFVGEKWVSDMD